MDSGPHVHPLSELTQDPAAFLAHLRKTGEAVLLAVDGRADLVVQDAASYRKLVELADRAQVVEAVRQGLDEMRAGLGRPADEVFDEIRREFSIPHDA